ncbi:MAG: flagellar hook-basal body complex protein, partial [Planctomycetota bacterium]
MGLQSAMATALTGLQAAEATIDVVGNNVANSNTVGFKESNVVFATQFLQTVSIGSAPSSSSGGTNPRQLGLGVNVAEISPDFSQGTIEISANPLDVAIQGDGFLVVQGSQGERLFTRNGQLNVNSLNELTTVTGQRVLGYSVNEDFELVTDSLVPLNIPLGEERVAQATENAAFNGVLNPAVDLGAVPAVVESAVLGNGSVAAPDDSSFTLDDVLVADPPASGVATATGDGGSGPGLGQVKYRVANVDRNGLEGTLSTEFSVNVTAAGTVQLDSLPPADGDTWVGRALYRSLPGTDDFRLVANLDETSTTFADNVLDANLGSALDDANVEAGTYSYYVTYYNPSTGVETRPTARIGSRSISDPAGGRVRLDFDLGDVSQPQDDGFTELRLYRNLTGESANFRLVDTLPVTTDTYVDNAASAQIAGAQQLDLDGPVASAGNLLTDLLVRNGEVYSNVFEPGTLTFGAKVDDVDLADKTLEIDAATTVQDLIDFMEEALGIQKETDVTDVPLPLTDPGVRIENGRLVVTSNLGEENAV